MGLRRAAFGAGWVFALWLACAGAWAVEPLVFFGDRDLPPFEYLDDGQPHGATVELARAVGRELGRPVEIRLLRWAESQARVLAGEGDALTQMVPTPEREKLFAFSRPALSLDFTLFVRTERAADLVKADLSTLRIGVTAGGLPRQWLMRERPQVTLVSMDSLRDGPPLLQRGDIDAFLAPTWPTLWMLEREGVVGVTKLPTLIGFKTGIAVRRGDSALLAQIDAALLKLEQSGELARIVDDWSPERMYLFSGSAIWLAKVAASMALAALVAIAAVAWVLRRQRSRLRAEIEQRRLAQARVHWLQALTAALGPAGTPAQVGDVVVTHAAGLADAPGAIVFQLSRSGREWQPTGLGGGAEALLHGRREFGVGKGMPLDLAVLGKEPLVFGSRDDVLAAHPHWAALLKDVPQQAFYVAALRATPTTSGAALPIGGLVLAWPKPRGFDADTREQLAAATLLVAQALERARLRSAEQRSAAMQVALQQLKSALGDVSTVDDACALIGRVGGARLGARHGEVALFAVPPVPGEAVPPDAELVLVGSTAAGGVTRWRADAQAPIARAAASGATVRVDGEDGAAPSPTQFALPLIAHPVSGLTIDGEATRIGAVRFEFEAGRDLDPEEHAFLETLAGIAGRAIERCQLIERLRANLAQSEAQRRQLDALVAQFPVGMIVVETPSGRLLRHSLAAEEISGIAALQVGSEINAYDWRARRYPGDGSGQRIAWHEWPLARVLRSGEATTPELLELERPDGGRRVVDTVATPIRDGTGAMIAAATLFIDVTEQLSAQQRQRETDLRLTLAMEATGMGSWDLDPATGEALWNAQLYRLLGLPVGEGRATRETFMSHVLDEDRPGVEAHMARALEEGGEFEATFRIRRADGELCWLMGRGRVLGDPRNRGRMIGVNLDVTPLMQVREQLEALNRQKDEFFAMISHELRNPLNPIATAAELLARAGERESVRAFGVDMIQRQVKVLARLVDDLTEFSRIRHGRLELHREPVALADAVEHACHSMQPLIDRQRQTLVVDLPASQGLRVNADPQRLTQMVTNLIGNAVNDTQQEGRIEVSARREGKFCALTVRDNGRGIAPEFLPLIFDMFTQDHVALGLPDGGLGLGLAIVRRLAELHGGTVVAESPGLGQGASFTLRLPTADGLG